MMNVLIFLRRIGKTRVIILLDSHAHDVTMLRMIEVTASVANDGCLLRIYCLIRVTHWQMDFLRFLF